MKDRVVQHSLTEFEESMFDLAKLADELEKVGGLPKAVARIRRARKVADQFVTDMMPAVLAPPSRPQPLHKTKRKLKPKLVPPDCIEARVTGSPETFKMTVSLAAVFTPKEYRTPRRGETYAPMPLFSKGPIGQVFVAPRDFTKSRFIIFERKPWHTGAK